MGYHKNLLIHQSERVEADRKAALLNTLRVASGPTLVAAVSSDLAKFDELVEVGLPRGDRLAELTMLYRDDCPVEFLRESRFKLEVLRDPALPLTTGRAVLGAKPTAVEISVLPGSCCERTRPGQVARQGRRGLRGSAVPAGRVAGAGSNTMDDEIVGILRNPNCPEAVARRYITCGSARIRLQGPDGDALPKAGHRVVARHRSPRPPHDRLRELPTSTPRRGCRQPHPRRPMTGLP
jgi:hypothetical protein